MLKRNPTLQNLSVECQTVSQPSREENRGVNQPLADSDHIGMRSPSCISCAAFWRSVYNRWVIHTLILRLKSNVFRRLAILSQTRIQFCASCTTIIQFLRKVSSAFVMAIVLALKENWQRNFSIFPDCQQVGYTNFQVFYRKRFLDIASARFPF